MASKLATHLKTVIAALIRFARDVFFVVVVGPYQTSYAPIDFLLNAPEEGTSQRTTGSPSGLVPGTRDYLTARWRESKLSELSFVGLTSALIASLFGSAFTWPIFTSSSWSTKACWYCGLICIIASITIATQQSILLHRFSSHIAAMSKVRQLLSHPKRNAQGRWLPRRMQMFVWQLAVMMLRFGILLFISGLTIVLWNQTIMEGDKRSLPDLKVAIAFTVALGFVLPMHFISVFYTYHSGAITKRNAEAFEGL